MKNESLIREKRPICSTKNRWEKKWMFSNTPRGARGSAIMYETAKENNLSSYHYLRYLFETLPNIDLNNKEEIDKVLL